MATLARLINLATGALAAARAPQAPVPLGVAREIAATSSGAPAGSAFSAQLLQGPVSGSSGSAQLHQAPAVALQSPGPVNPTLPATQFTPRGVKINGIKSLSILLSASAMTFLTGCNGSDAVLPALLVGGAGAALGIRTWWESHTVKQLVAQEFAPQQKVVDDAISELESNDMQGQYFAENPHKALEVVQAMKTEAEALQLKQKQDATEMESLKNTAEGVLTEMEQTRAEDGATSYYDLNPEVVRMLTDFMATCDAVLEDADRSALGNLDDLLNTEIPRLLEEITQLVTLRETELKQLRTAEEKAQVLENKIQTLLGKQVKLAHGMAERARMATDLVVGVRALQDRVDHARAWSELSLVEKLRRFLPRGASVDVNLLQRLQAKQQEEAQAESLRAAQPAGASGAQARQMSAQGGGS